MYKYSSHHLQTRDVSFICMKMNAYNIFKSIKQVHPQSLSWLQACVLKLLKNFFTSPEESLVGGGGICFVFQKFLGCNELLYAWDRMRCFMLPLVKLSLREVPEKTLHLSISRCCCLFNRPGNKIWATFFDPLVYARDHSSGQRCLRIMISCTFEGNSPSILVYHHQNVR